MLWGILGGFLFLVLLVVWVITVSDIVRRHLGAKKTAGWLIIVLLLPFVGSVLWWTLRKPTDDEVAYQLESEMAVRDQARRRKFDSTGI